MIYRRFIDSRLLQAKAVALKLSRQKAKERRKLSTGVQLLDPDQLRASKRQKTSPDGSSTVLSEAMLAFPEVMQKFMQDMKYPEPTPVQERYEPGTCAPSIACACYLAVVTLFRKSL